MRKDFSYIYKHVIQTGAKVMIATNATLINKEIACLFRKYQPAEVCVSIYGWDRYSYEKTTRCSGSFSKFVKGVKTLRDTGIPFNMKMPAVPWLLANKISVARFAKDLGAKNDLPFVWALYPRARPNPSMTAEILQLRLTPKEAAKFILSNPSFVKRDTQLLAKAKRTEMTDNRLLPCLFSKKRFTVDAYGFLQVCPELRHPQTIYDLKTGSLRHAFVEFVPKVKDLQINDFIYFQRCGKCLFQSICVRCPACAWLEHGSLVAPVEYFCRVAHEEAQLLGFISQNDLGWEIAELRRTVDPAIQSV